MAIRATAIRAGRRVSKKRSKRGAQRTEDPLNEGMEAISVNVQCPEEAITALELYASQNDLLSMQEVRMNEQEVNTFARTCDAKAYKIYHVPRPTSVVSWHAARESGGAMALVRKTLKQEPKRQSAASRHQLLILMATKWNILVVCTPPDMIEKISLEETLQEVIVQEALTSQQ